MCSISLFDDFSRVISIEFSLFVFDTTMMCVGYKFALWGKVFCDA